MSIVDALRWIQGSHLSRAISKSNPVIIAWLQVIHIAGFVLLLAAVTLTSLRLFGRVLRSMPVESLIEATSRLLWLGLSLAVATGALMFIGSPTHYFFNRAFDVKMVLLVLAVVFQLTVFRTVLTGDPARNLRRRATVLIWLALWFSIGIAGRAIGFV